MKIAYITSSFPFGTTESFFASEISSLASTEINLTVIPINPRGARRSDWIIPNHVKTMDTGIFSPTVFVICITSLFFKPRTILKSLIFLLRNSRFDRILIKNIAIIPKAIWLADKIVKTGVQHIHVQWGGTTSTAAMIAAQISGLEWSLTCHRWDIYENNLLKVKSQSAKFIRFISKRGLQESLKYGVIEDRSTTITMGVAIEKISPKSSCNRSTPTIMCAANLIEIKGHRYLIEAISILKANRISVKLLLAGDGPLKESLVDFVKSLDLMDKISFLGNISHDRLISMYRQQEIDIFVLPSIDLGSGNHEGVPVSLMEAMSFGIPVVSTKTGSIEELLPSSMNLTVPEKNSTALANVINKLVSDGEYYSSISNDVQEIVKENWSSAASANKLIKKITDLQSSHRSF